MNKYSITVTNNSGNQQKYAIFNKAPVITGRVQPKIWHNVFAVANTPDSSTGKFTMYKQYYAIVGSSEGTPADGVTVNVNGVRPATLGSTADDGTAIKGTSFNMLVQNEAPQFAKAELAANGYVNAFEIVTNSDFKFDEAVSSELHSDLFYPSAVSLPFQGGSDQR